MKLSNAIGHKYITETQKGTPAPLHYLGFPKSVCTSLNEVVCHGIPSYDEVLQDGDILNIDVTVIKDGYHGDTGRMYSIGSIDEDSAQLVKDTRAAMFAAVFADASMLHDVLQASTTGTHVPSLATLPL